MKNANVRVKGKIIPYDETKKIAEETSTHRNQRVIYYPYKQEPEYELYVRNCIESIENKNNFSWSVFGYMKNKEYKLEDFFPPDFIAEYTGQIRAWFYVLHVIGEIIYDSPAFKNVVVEGVILGTDGRKMSKNYGNYPDPKELLQKYIKSVANK